MICLKTSDWSWLHRLRQASKKEKTTHKKGHPSASAECAAAPLWRS